MMFEFNPFDETPLQAQIERVGGDAWADAYGAWVYRRMTALLDLSMAQAPWRERVTFYAVPDYRPQVIPRAEGDINIQVSSYGRLVTLPPTVFSNNDRALIADAPLTIARMIQRTVDRQISGVLAYRAPDETVAVAFLYGATRFTLRLARLKGEAGGPWALDQPLALRASVVFGVGGSALGSLGEMEPAL